MNKFKNISGAFFITVLVAVLYFCFLIFKPFLGAIVLAGAIVVSSYPLFQWFLSKTNNRRSVSAFFATFSILLAVILPVLLFFIYVAGTSIEAYKSFEQLNAPGALFDLSQQLQRFPMLQGFDLNSVVLEVAAKVNGYLVNGLAAVVTGTTNFITQMIIMVMTMYFFYIDGGSLLKKVMKWTPLDDKYDMQIFKNFRDVSHGAIVSSFLTGLVQGLLGAIAFAIVGVPYVLLGTALLFASFIPFVGGALVWLPVAAFLALSGKFAAALFMTVWGVFIISLSDNILRPFLMKGDTDMHPMILFFAIFGGITVFGFFGIIYGPLLVSIAITLLKLYEKEYNGILHHKKT